MQFSISVTERAKKTALTHTFVPSWPEVVQGKKHMAEQK
jgi:hypothetical protein